jgi:DNA-binding response OmpR family regulator
MEKSLRHILVVATDTWIQGMLERMLQTFGYTTTAVTTVAMVVQVHRIHPADAIIVNVGGLLHAATILAALVGPAGQPVPVIGLHDATMPPPHGLSLARWWWVQKPFSFATLQQILTEVLHTAPSADSSGGF